VVRRSFDEELLERVRAYSQTEPYRKALRKRKVWVELMFAEAKEWHGMRRFRLRTLRGVNIEVLMIAAGQNIKRLLTFRGRGPRHLAQAAALRPPAPTHYSLVIGHLLRNHRVGDPEHASFSTRWGVPGSPYPATCINHFLEGTRQRLEVVWVGTPGSTSCEVDKDAKTGCSGRRPLETEVIPRRTRRALLRDQR
jgi:Transposase DDE domain